MKPLESEVVREAPAAAPGARRPGRSCGFPQEAPPQSRRVQVPFRHAVAEQKNVSTLQPKPTRGRRDEDAVTCVAYPRRAEENHKADHEEEDDVPPPPAKKPARLTAEALAKLEAETTQKKAPLPERCVNITWPKNHKATEAGVMDVLRAFGCSDVVKVSCRTKSAVTLFATPAAAKKAVSKIRDASGTVEGYDMSTWKAFLASEALAIRASKSSAPLSPQKPPSVASSALRRSQEREEQRQKMASEQPTPVVGRRPSISASRELRQFPPSTRLVKVTYMGGYKPTAEAQLALDVEQAGGAPFVNAKLKKKSAVLLFSCTADAEA